MENKTEILNIKKIINKIFLKKVGNHVGTGPLFCMDTKPLKLFSKYLMLCYTKESYRYTSFEQHEVA